jgi:hypothetical protein
MLTRGWLWLVLAGCAPHLPAVRLRGAELLKCPAQHIAIERTGDYDWKALGCGYAIAMRCSSPGGEGWCMPAPVVHAPGFTPNVSFMGDGRVMTAISEPIIAPPPPVLPYQPSYRPPPPPPQTHIYMPGQYNPNTGTIQHDYAHQYTRPYTPPPPVYTPPPVYHPPTYHHY